MDFSDHCFLVSVYTRLVLAGRRFAGMLYHVMFIPIHNLPEQKPVTEGNETKADAFVCGTVFSGISDICAIYTSCPTWLSLSGTKRLFSQVGTAARKDTFQHYVH
jgi:hypothetical protein